jgi:hypothetical protein
LGGTWKVTGDYTEVNIPGGEVGVIWKNGFPQFLSGKVALGSDVYFTDFMVYTTYTDQDPWQKVSGLEQTIPPGAAGELITLAPDVIFDSSGLHITLTDSSRVIDVETADIEKQIVFDAEYNLYKIFDADGKISAEYDLGQGKEGDADFVPTTGWVDIQKLSKDLVCEEGDGKSCMTDYSNLHVQNSVWFEVGSAGIFRYKEVKDENDQTLGTTLLLQVVSRDRNQNPIAVWMLAQAETVSEPGINKFRALAGFNLAIIDHLNVNSDNKKTFPIQKWETWMKKGSWWTFSLSKEGRSYTYSFTGEKKGTYGVIAEDFIANRGKINQDDDIILVNNGASVR